jgi:hypothetical protein
VESIVWELDSHLIGSEFDLGLERERGRDALVVELFFHVKI